MIRWVRNSNKVLDEEKLPWKQFLKGKRRDISPLRAAERLPCTHTCAGFTCQRVFPPCVFGLYHSECSCSQFDWFLGLSNVMMWDISAGKHWKRLDHIEWWTVSRVEYKSYIHFMVIRVVKLLFCHLLCGWILKLQKLFFVVVFLKKKQTIRNRRMRQCCTSWHVPSLPWTHTHCGGK